MLASFDSGVTNRLGGYYNMFAGGARATAQAALHTWPDGRRALTLDWDKAPSSFGGLWIHLFDFTLPDAERLYLDSSPFDSLTFWVRGERGGERILLKAADAALESREDAAGVGELAHFLAAGAIAPEWRRAIIPLSAFPPRLDRGRLASLVLEAAGAGSGRIGVKDVAFCSGPAEGAPLGPPLAGAARPRKRDKALWVWNTGEILAGAVEQQALLEFARQEAFTDLFLQLQDARQGASRPGELTLERDRWRCLLSALNGHGIRAHALDGFKNYALPEWHDGVLATVENVIRYNRSVNAGERFYGIRYDIEPYLIAGFSGPHRQRIAESYLALLEKIAWRTQPALLPLGVDIPFWYDSRNELTGDIPAVDFRGRRKPASQHVIDLADNVAVMDYRTSAYGADGIVSLAAGELAYAAKAGKRLFVGLETIDLPDEELMDFEGVPSVGMDSPPSSSRALVLSEKPGPLRLWSVSSSQWEWLRSELRAQGRDPGRALWWPVRRRILVPGHKLSFSRLGAGPFHGVMVQAEQELSVYNSFAGFAVHDYAGYRRLLDR